MSINISSFNALIKKLVMAGNYPVIREYTKGLEPEWVSLTLLPMLFTERLLEDEVITALVVRADVDSTCLYACYFPLENNNSISGVIIDLQSLFPSDDGGSFNLIFVHRDRRLLGMVKTYEGDVENISELVSNLVTDELLEEVSGIFKKVEDLRSFTMIGRYHPDHSPIFDHQLPDAE